MAEDNVRCIYLKECDDFDDAYDQRDETAMWNCEYFHHRVVPKQHCGSGRCSAFRPSEVDQAIDRKSASTVLVSKIQRLCNLIRISKVSDVKELARSEIHHLSWYESFMPLDDMTKTQINDIHEETRERLVLLDCLAQAIDQLGLSCVTLDKMPLSQAFVHERVSYCLTKAWPCARSLGTRYIYGYWNHKKSDMPLTKLREIVQDIEMYARIFSQAPTIASN